MRLKPVGRHCLRVALLLTCILGMWSLGLARSKKSKGGGDFDLTGIVLPTLINGQTDPTLRYPVMSLPGSVFSITYGWLDISNSTIRYTVMHPTRKSDHDFDVSRFGIMDLRMERTILSFKSPKKHQMLIYLPEDRWGTVHSGPGMGSAANRESLGTTSIYKTLLNFDRVMAIVKPPPPPAPVIVQRETPLPAPKPAAPPSPPAIVLSAPAGAAENQTLHWAEPTVVIRGVAMDSTGIPVVKINGTPVNMRPQTAQAAEFWSDPLHLQEGNNPVEVIATNSAHVQTKLALTVDYESVKPTPPAINPKALDRLDIIGLLQGGVPPDRVIELIKSRGVKFSPSDDDENAIRAAGGTDDLINAIRQAAPHP